MYANAVTDVLLFVATKALLKGRRGHLVKLLAVKHALVKYRTVVHMDLAGLSPFSTRSASRRCVPFTECYPDDWLVLLPVSPLPPHYPTTEMMMFRRSSVASSLIQAAVGQPSSTNILPKFGNWVWVD